MPERMMKTKYYSFYQNNSGGHVDIDENVNIVVVIEAANYKEANQRAEDIGIEFYQGCPCCGDRWHHVDEDDAEDYPHHFNKPLDKAETWWSDYREEYSSKKRMGAIIHHYDGSKEFWAVKNKRFIKQKQGVVK